MRGRPLPRRKELLAFDLGLEHLPTLVVGLQQAKLRLEYLLGTKGDQRGVRLPEEPLHRLEVRSRVSQCVAVEHLCGAEILALNSYGSDLVSRPCINRSRSANSCKIRSGIGVGWSLAVNVWVGLRIAKGIVGCCLACVCVARDEECVGRRKVAKRNEGGHEPREDLDSLAGS